MNVKKLQIKAKARRHHVKVRETENEYVLDGGIHIPKARTYAKQEVDMYLARWDINRHKAEQLYEKRLNRVAKMDARFKKLKDNSKPVKFRIVPERHIAKSRGYTKPRFNWKVYKGNKLVASGVKLIYDDAFSAAHVEMLKWWKK